MRIRLLLFCCCFIGFTFSGFAQRETREKLYTQKHFVFFNFSNLFDPNGSSLQFGYNYQLKDWLDGQLELGFVSDNLTSTSLPFKEYAGFRIRPQVKFLTKSGINKKRRLYGSVLFSYQHLNFRENQNFDVGGNFNQNITYRGRDQTFAVYLAGGVDSRIFDRIVTSFSIALGRVYIHTKVNEGEIPEEAFLIENCVLFCRRNTALDESIYRAGILIDFKIGYRF